MTGDVASVRLTEKERENIVQAVQATSAALAIEAREVSLFGSRTDPNKKGGDIDLYVCIAIAGEKAFDFKRDLRIKLNELLGEQKFDLVIDDGQSALGAFGQIIHAQKVVLWKRS